MFILKWTNLSPSPVATVRNLVFISPRAGLFSSSLYSSIKIDFKRKVGRMNKEQLQKKKIRSQWHRKLIVLQNNSLCIKVKLFAPTKTSVILEAVTHEVNI